MPAGAIDSTDLSSLKIGMSRTVQLLITVLALSCCQTRPATGAPTIPSTTPPAPGAPKPPAPDRNRMVHSDILTRTFQIRPKGSKEFGTGFLIHLDGREYLVTAAHVVVGLKDVLEVLWKKNWTTIGAKLVGTAAKPVDIAVLALERAISE